MWKNIHKYRVLGLGKNTCNFYKKILKNLLTIVSQRANIEHVDSERKYKNIKKKIQKNISKTVDKKKTKQYNTRAS